MSQSEKVEVSRRTPNRCNSRTSSTISPRDERCPGHIPTARYRSFEICDDSHGSARVHFVVVQLAGQNHQKSPFATQDWELACRTFNFKHSRLHGLTGHFGASWQRIAALFQVNIRLLAARFFPGKSAIMQRLTQGFIRRNRCPGEEVCRNAQTCEVFLRDLAYAPSVCCARSQLFEPVY